MAGERSKVDQGISRNNSASVFYDSPNVSKEMHSLT